MLHKLKQYSFRSKRRIFNLLPFVRSNQFLLNYLRVLKGHKNSASVRASMGFIRFSTIRQFSVWDTKALKSFCILSGRDRGVSRRFVVARTKLQSLATSGQLFGLRKSSW